ncbi:U-box-domain-containing protein [Myriangium duriaei CBS 260.36]|uniref:U-box-domain-containing protein n=1 Tax=Myriangium duriaei CBS 260.36 TaxID=1168546 RepID=A0A9P4IYC0_9PEZI|nr:U-box-domain-containing protein [Myriangium duriaei CBS 260.36]
MAHHAESLKKQGNELFKEGDFAGAEEQYTQAILRYSKNPLIFTNRAFARIKLQRWEGVVDDCLHSIELTGHDQNFKAYFYLAQAQLALHHPHEALSSALTAYDQAMYPRSPSGATPASSMSAIVALVIRCRKAKFESRQREIQKRRGDLLGELEDSIDRRKRSELAEVEAQLKNDEIGPVAAEEARTEIIDNAAKKVDDIKNVFAIADPENHAKREVPEWAIDTITFELMHDPVITTSGHSYERQTLVEHLKRSPTDPLTRNPLTIDDLRPNIALRKALEEFWDNAQTWAVDW